MARTILCVEDEQDTGDLLQTILEHEGVTIDRALAGGANAYGVIGARIP